VKQNEKGKRGEREFAELCRNHGFAVRRGQQYSGIEGRDVVGLDGFHVEVKWQERVRIFDWMKQAEEDSGDSQDIPVVALKRNRKPWLVTMRVEDFLKLIGQG